MQRCRTGVAGVFQNTDDPYIVYLTPLASAETLPGPRSSDFPEWTHPGIPECGKDTLAPTGFPSQEGAYIPQKSCPHNLSLYMIWCNNFSALTHTPCPQGRSHSVNTWQPRAARRNPRTVGDAGAAPVTIIRTQPPRLACGEREALA